MDQESKDLDRVHPILSEDELKLLLSPDQLHRLGHEQAGTKQMPFVGEASFYDQVQQLQRQMAALNERVELLEQRLAAMAGQSQVTSGKGTMVRMGASGEWVTVERAETTANEWSGGGDALQQEPVTEGSTAPTLELSKGQASRALAVTTGQVTPTPSRLDTYGRRKRRT